MASRGRHLTRAAAQGQELKLLAFQESNACWLARAASSVSWAVAVVLSAGKPVAMVFLELQVARAAALARGIVGTPLSLHGIVRSNCPVCQLVGPASAARGLAGTVSLAANVVAMASRCVVLSTASGSTSARLCGIRTWSQ